MEQSTRRNLVRSYVAGSAWILSEVQSAFSDIDVLNGIASVQALLEDARRLLDGKDEAREKKNAADRARRAKRKAKKPRSIGKAVSRRAPILHPPLGME